MGGIGRGRVLLLRALATAVVVSAGADAASAAAGDTAKEPVEEPAEAPNFRDPMVFLSALRDFGYKAQIKKNGDQPKIESRAEALNYTITFFGCTEGTDCEVAILSASWNYSGDNGAYRVVNDWNGDRLAGRAWASPSERYIGLDRTLNLLHRPTTAAIESEISWWGSIMVDFRNFLVREVFSEEGIDGRPREAWHRI